MQQKLVVLVCAFLQLAICSAQEKKKGSELFFQSISSFGIVCGQSETAPQIQSTNGLKYKTWFVGIGAGLDFYNRTSLPLSLDCRKNIFSQPKTPFVYLKAGINFPLKKKGSLFIDQEEGAYYDIGAGYHLCLNKSQSLQFSAGYSFKEFSERKYNPTVIILSTWPPPANYIEKYHYRLNRISIRMAWSFSIKI